MPSWMRWTQRGLLLGVGVAMTLGTLAMATLLRQSEAQFEESWVLAIGYSLSINLVIAFLIKSLLGLLSWRPLQFAGATVICLAGLAAGGFSLVGNSHQYTPKTEADEIAALEQVLSLEGVGTPGGNFDPYGENEPTGAGDDALDDSAGLISISLAGEPLEIDGALELDSPLNPGLLDPSFWGEGSSPWIIASQVTSEVIAAALMWFTWAFNQKTHRRRTIHDTPEFKELDGRNSEARRKLQECRLELGRIEGTLDSIASERAVFTEEAFGNFL